MNLLAVGAGKLRCFHFGSGPELLVDCLAGCRQLGRSGAANKEPLNYGAGFCFSYGRCAKKLHSLEAVDNARLIDVIRRHLKLNAIANCKSNKSFAHFPGNVREHKMLVGESNPEHGAGQDRHDRSFQLDGFF